MKDRIINDWEEKIDSSKLKDNKDYDLNSIYERAHSELSLQQSKRDQIITIYLALCSFLLPFALGEEFIPELMKGIIFIVLGFVGLLFSCSAVRYREYKEAYWLCCQSITVLLGFDTNELDKATVQRVYFHCLGKKGKRYLKEKGEETRFKRWLYVKNNVFSSETLHFVIIALMCSFITGLGVSLIFDILLGIGIGLIVFLFLVWLYFHICIRVYRCLEVRNRKNDEAIRDTYFNKVFSKAWFLHFYYD